MTAKNEPTTPAEPASMPDEQAVDRPVVDPFDPAALRLDQTFLEGGGARKLLLTVPVRKPNRQDFSRVHSGTEYRETVALIELKDDREIFLLVPEVARHLPGEFSTCTLFTAINRQRVVHLWPVKLPGPDGKILEWHRSAAAAAERAMSAWVRVTADMSLGAYQVFEASAAIPDPVWPDVTFRELLRVAFRDRLVADLDHPLIKRLRGLV